MSNEQLGVLNKVVRIAARKARNAHDLQRLYTDFIISQVDDRALSQIGQERPPQDLISTWFLKLDGFNFLQKSAETFHANEAGEFGFG